MHKLYIIIILLFIASSCRQKEIISIEKPAVDIRFIGTWVFKNSNNEYEKYTFFNNNKIEYSCSNNYKSNDSETNKILTYEWKKEGGNYYYRLWNNELDNWSDFLIKYINTNMIKIYSDFFEKSYI